MQCAGFHKCCEKTSESSGSSAQLGPAWYLYLFCKVIFLYLFVNYPLLYIDCIMDIVR
jgi:hypothetical protein